MTTAVFDAVADELAERVRRVVREELQGCAGFAQSHPEGFLNVESAARYLDSTPEAIRSAEKRKQLRAHRSTTGRLLFTREDLDAFARGEAA